MLDAGLRAILTCVDPKQLDKRFVGREFDEQFLAELPESVDPCGERGEFHTFCYRCPELRLGNRSQTSAIYWNEMGSGSLISDRQRELAACIQADRTFLGVLVS